MSRSTVVFIQNLTLAELGHVLICRIMLNLKPSPECLWNLKGLSTHFFSHLRGGINCPSHLALISAGVSRISSTVVRNWLETSLLESGTLPSWRLVCHSTDILCSWCKTLFEIWKLPTFLLCGQDNPSFLPLHWTHSVELMWEFSSSPGASQTDKAKFSSGLYPSNPISQHSWTGVIQRRKRN